MSWEKYFEVVGFIFLAAPLLWEITNDKDGDAHISRGPLFQRWQLLSKKVDVFVRVGLTIAAALLNWYFNGVNVFKSGLVAFALHFMFFDYAIAYVLIRRGIVRGHWFTFLGSKGMDNFFYWRTMDPVGRLVVRVLVLALALAIYFYQPK